MHWLDIFFCLLAVVNIMVLIDYDLIDMICLITVMHVFALDTVNSNLLFGISSVAVLVAEHQIKRYPIVK